MLKRVLDDNFGAQEKKSVKTRQEDECNKSFALVKSPRINQGEVEGTILRLVLVAQKLLLVVRRIT